MSGRLPRFPGVVATVDTAGEGGFFAPTNMPQTDTSTAADTGADQVRVIQFVLPIRAVVRNVVFEVVTLSAGGLASVGIYDKDSNRLLHSGAISTATTGVKSGVVSPSVTLEPGVYFLAWTFDNTTARFRGVLPTGFLTLLSKNATRTGFAANASVSGVLPATLGTITLSTGMTPAIGYFEP